MMDRIISGMLRVFLCCLGEIIDQSLVNILHTVDIVGVGELKPRCRSSWHSLFNHILPPSSDAVKRSLPMPRCSEWIHKSCLTRSTSFIDESCEVSNSSCALEVTCIIRVLMKSSDATLGDVIWVMHFHVGFKIFQLMIDKVAHCISVVNLVICDMTRCNTVSFLKT